MTETGLDGRTGAESPGLCAGNYHRAHLNESAESDLVFLSALRES